MLAFQPGESTIVAGSLAGDFTMPEIGGESLLSLPAASASRHFAVW